MYESLYKYFTDLTAPHEYIKVCFTLKFAFYFKV